jgi:hypothetical protein
MNPLSHNLQMIDYNIFLRDAGLMQGDFSRPSGWAKDTAASIASAHGHFRQVGCSSVRG